MRVPELVNIVLSGNAVEEVKSHPPLPGTKTAAVNALSSASANVS